jgi:hypothetical protein
MTKPGCFLIPFALLSLTACTTTAPVVDQSHPASVEAAESPSRSLPHLLSADELTQRTHALLAKREADAMASENEAPGDQTNIAAPKEQQPTHHEHHHQ